MATQYIWDMDRLWNNALTKFFGIKMNVTDTASDADSRLLEVQVASASMFSVRKDGAVFAAGSYLSADGSAASPTYAFSADTNTGVYRPGGDALGLVAGGVEVARAMASGIRAMLNGTAAAPSIAFQNDGDTGIYLNAVGTMGVAVAGGDVLLLDSTGVRVDKVGSAANPSLYFRTRTAGAHAGFFSPAVSEIGISCGGTEMGRIDSDGDLLWGQASTAIPGAGNTTVGFGLSQLGILRINGGGSTPMGVARNNSGAAIIFYAAGSDVGSVDITGSGTTYNTTSDYRLKNELPMPADYSSVDRVRRAAAALRYFEWKEKPEVKQLGWFAHDLENIMPLAVTGTKDAVDENGKIIPQKIDYSKSVPDLVAALEAAFERIDALEKKIAGG